MAGLFNNIQMTINQNAPFGISRGALISFEYKYSMAKNKNIIHDTRPLVLVSDVFSNFVRGVNLHYLTLPIVKKLLVDWGGNSGFNYLNIRSNIFISDSFRVYNLAGMKGVRRLDDGFLKTVLNSARMFDAGEIERIRTDIQNQIRSSIQPSAYQLNTPNMNPQYQQSNVMQPNQNIGQQNMTGNINSNNII